MTTQGELPLAIPLGQGHGGSLVCHNQASVAQLGAGPELGRAPPSEAELLSPLPANPFYSQTHTTTYQHLLK